MIAPAIHILQKPDQAAATKLLAAAQLPVADLTEEHLDHFFYCGPAQSPSGLVGLEPYGPDALLRSLVVTHRARNKGLGAALVAHVENFARAQGARSIFLLTTTAEAFFGNRGYRRVPRDEAPASIRTTREFADLCPASSAFMVRTL
jgi:amino-acid N-acetyltransferase